MVKYSCRLEVRPESASCSFPQGLDVAEMISCNICGWTAESFKPLYDMGDVYCPSCGSYERHRALVYYLEHEGILAGSGTALEIGSGLVRAIRLYLEKRPWTYYSLDCWATAGAVDVCGEASDLPFSSACFDLVVCTHVLEHVEDEFAALREIRRVTRSSGLALIQVPYDDTVFATKENELPSNGRARTGCHYHHRRNYGLDIRERLNYFFSRVDEVDPSLVIPESVARSHGFERNFGTTFFCSGGTSPETGMIYRGQLHRDLLGMKRFWLTQRAAYFRGLARNGYGSPLEDWLQAEGEVAQISDPEVGRWNVYDILGFS